MSNTKNVTNSQDIDHAATNLNVILGFFLFLLIKKVVFFILITLETSKV